jgi:serine/threonine-protein kinase
MTPEPSQKVTVTNTEFAVGTPGYMCPEQARGEEMDNRGDLYSVGVILYELLTGRLPFAGKSTMDMLLAHATEEPPPFSYVGAAGWVPPAIEAVVQSCLAKEPADRPANARELAERYEAGLAGEHQPAAAGPVFAPSARVPPRSSVRVPRIQTASSGLVNPAPAPPPPPKSSGVHDHLAIVQHLEAYMPEKIATVKLRGFIHDVGGEVVESVPGRIRVRLGGKGSIYSAPTRGSFAWLGIGRRGQIDLELRMHRPDAARDGQLHITVVLRPVTGDLSTDLAWRSVCTQIFCDLRGYLMGQTGAVGADAVG